MEKTILVGKIVRDPYGSYSDCSPGLYLDKEDGGDICISSGQNASSSMFNEFEDKRIRVTIEVLPDLVEENDEPTINISISNICDKGAWIEFCEWKGWNEWIINEGRIEKGERVEIPVSKAKELGLI
jgi:hypothetical protein